MALHITGDTAADELLVAFERLDDLIERYPLRGIKGPVGTAQDMLDLVDGDEQRLAQLESAVAAHLGFSRVLDSVGQVTLYPAVPMTIQRVANIERAQMLVESPSRAALQRFLAAWHPVLLTTRQQPEHKGLIRWAVDVDPLVI